MYHSPTASCSPPGVAADQETGPSYVSEPDGGRVGDEQPYPTERHNSAADDGELADGVELAPAVAHEQHCDDDGSDREQQGAIGDDAQGDREPRAVDLVARFRWWSSDANAERNRPDGLVQICRINDHESQDVRATLQLGHLGEQRGTRMSGTELEVFFDFRSQVQQLHVAGAQ